MESRQKTMSARMRRWSSSCLTPRTNFHSPMATMRKRDWGREGGRGVAERMTVAMFAARGGQQRGKEKEKGKRLSSRHRHKLWVKSSHLC